MQAYGIPDHWGISGLNVWIPYKIHMGDCQAHVRGMHLLTWVSQDLNEMGGLKANKERNLIFR